MEATLAKQQLQVMDGKFSPIEATDVITKMIDDQINACKIQHLSRWIKNDTENSESVNDKVIHLNRCKNEFMRIIQEAKAEGCEVELSGNFTITLAK